MRTPRSQSVPPDGHFSEDGQSFVIPRPDTTHPMVNIISTGDYAVALAQTGAGHSWGRRPSEPVTKGAARFIRDAGGRALYLRDDRTGRFWSAGWQPLRTRPESYECIHGVGYSLITSQTEGIQAQWLAFVPCEESLEIWRVRLRNLTKKPRSISLWSGIEWAADRAASGEGAPFVHEGGRVLLAKARPSTSDGRDAVFFHGVNLATRGHTLDRRALLGPYGSSEAPEALKKGRYLPNGAAGNGGEPFAGLCVPFILGPGEERSVLFTVGSSGSQSEALLKARKFQDFSQVDQAWNRTQMFWDRYLSAFSVRTPDKGFDLLVNTWLKYQALSWEFWSGRGPRDARIFLSMEPDRVRREILLRAAGGRAAFSPRSFSDVPWPVLLVDYLRETGEGRLLSEKMSPGTTLYASALKAVKEMSSHPLEEPSGMGEFFSDWADMLVWAVDEGHLAAREGKDVKKFKMEAEARRKTSRANGRFGPLHGFQEACRLGHGAQAWDAYKVLSPLPAAMKKKGGDFSLPAFFVSETSERRVSAAAFFRVCAEGLLGVSPSWRGLRVHPCLPPGWTSAFVQREFRGALYAVRIRRNSSKPAGFQEILLNGRKVKGDVLPVMFGRKNEVQVTVGKPGRP